MTALALRHTRTVSMWPVLAVGLVIVMSAMVLPASHAIQRHGDEAVAVRQCVRNSPTIVFKDKREADKFYLLCQLPDGKWGMQVVKRFPKVLQEITAFIPKDGTWGEVSQYVLRAATRFTGSLP